MLQALLRDWDSRKQLLAAGYRVCATSRSVSPSGFRTGFLSKNSLVSVESKIADYQSVIRTHERYNAMNGKQDGDPEKAAALFIQLAENPDPPLHFWLGANAVDCATDKIESMAVEIKKWKALSVSAEFI